jgi:uncharacterized delta-60 repeat protein
MDRVNLVAIATSFAFICSTVCDAQNFALVSYREWDGSIDTNFGYHGRVATTFPTTDSASLYDLAIDTDGRIVAVGTAGGKIAVARYHSDGSLDGTLGGDGRLLISRWWFSTEPLEARAVSLHNGKIVLAVNMGSNLDQRMALVRLDEDGTDVSWRFPSFNAFGCTSSTATAIIVDSQDRIILGGSAVCPHPSFAVPVPFFALARYQWDGTPDTSFGKGGATVQTFYYPYFDSLGFASATRINDVVADASGRIVAAGQYLFYLDQFSLTSDFVVARFMPDGELDPSFNAPWGGVAFVPHDLVPWSSPTKYARGFGVVVQSTGRILAAGSIVQPKSIGSGVISLFTVAALTENGTLESSFGSDGESIAPFTLTNPWLADAEALALYLDGPTILAAGWMGDSGDERFAIARFSLSGKLDSGFGNQGMVVTDFTCRGGELAWAVRVRPSPSPFGYRVIVGGTAHGLPCRVP